jgi:histidyl-tRNA synthetase
MTDALKAPRGCPDWLPEDYYLAEEIVKKAERVSENYGFKGFKTPIFEHAPVFTKSLGDASDIITKEMYSFQDKNEETFILRPEATAPLVRLFLSHKLKRELPLKMFTYGPMFRYERPQKGRQRQFHQIGVEHLGAPKDLFTEFETITMGQNFLNSLNLKTKTKVLINALGDSEQRQKFKEALIHYLNPLKEKLSEDSQTRLQTNPLRILDSKSKEDQELLKEAPKLYDFLSKEQKDHTEALIKNLKDLGIDAELNPLLVRGLDYYNDLVFEIVALEGLGAQSTVLAGGRYDSLISSMGGDQVNAIGWGAGLERLMLLSNEAKIPTPDLGLVVAQDDESFLIKTSHEIRSNNLSLYVPTSGNFSKKMQKCQKQGVKWCIVIGEDELKNNFWTLKNFSTGEQIQKNAEDSISFFKEQFSSDL